jgi:hypothetical protein
VLGDAEAAVVQRGDHVSVFYSVADQVRAGTVQGVMQNLVMTTAGTPKVTLSTEQVEDKSMKVIQYYVPGLLGWALRPAAPPVPPSRWSAGATSNCCDGCASRRWIHRQF